MRLQGGSENVNFPVHGLHATLVQRQIFDEITWARLPPDHPHEEIERLFSTIEEFLKNENCPEFGCVSHMIKYLQEELLKSKYAKMAVCYEHKVDKTLAVPCLLLSYH
eukprot:5086212-Pleurochrysis_carterae.AAC.1